MSEPRILNPQGMPVSKAEYATSGDIAISTDFNLQTGRGTVKFKIPVTAAAAELVRELRSCLPPKQDIKEVDARIDVILTQLERMLPEGGAAYQMLPAEARILGMQLICQSEEAVGNAVYLRTLLEIVQVPPNEAVQMLRTIGAGTRQDHALTYEKMLMAAEQAKKLEETDGTGTAH